MNAVFANTVAPEQVVCALRGAGELRVWLDDDLVDRRAPDGWVHVTTVAQAVALLNEGRVVELSLDNDLSDDDRYGQGKEVVDFLCEQQYAHGRDLWPRDGLTIHTANSQARDTMTRAIERYAGQTRPLRRTITPGGKRRFLFGGR